MQPPVTHQVGQCRTRFEHHALRKIEPFRVAPRPAHQIIKPELRDINQHQARQNLAHPEPDFEHCRNERIERSADRPHNECKNNHPRPCIHSMGRKRQDTADDRANRKLPLCADIPQIRAETIHQSAGDKHQRRPLDRQLLQRPALRKWIDEINKQRLNRRFSQRQDNQSPNPHRDKNRQHGRKDLRQLGYFRPWLNIKPHALPLCRLSSTVRSRRDWSPSRRPAPRVSRHGSLRSCPKLQIFHQDLD